VHIILLRVFLQSLSGLNTEFYFSAGPSIVENPARWCKGKALPSLVLNLSECWTTPSRSHRVQTLRWRRVITQLPLMTLQFDCYFPNPGSSPFAGLVSSGQFFAAIQFVIKYPECFGNIILLSLVSFGETACPFHSTATLRCHASSFWDPQVDSSNVFLKRRSSCSRGFVFLKSVILRFVASDTNQHVLPSISGRQEGLVCGPFLLRKGP
jgi:hypothetical protein